MCEHSCAHLKYNFYSDFFEDDEDININNLTRGISRCEILNTDGTHNWVRLVTRELLISFRNLQIHDVSSVKKKSQVTESLVRCQRKNYRDQLGVRINQIWNLINISLMHIDDSVVTWGSASNYDRLVSSSHKTKIELYELEWWWTSLKT